MEQSLMTAGNGSIICFCHDFLQTGLSDNHVVVSINMNDVPQDPWYFDVSESNTGSTDLFSDETDAERRKSGQSTGIFEVGSQPGTQDHVSTVSACLLVQYLPWR